MAHGGDRAAGAEQGGDAVDAILAQWARERPDVDASPMGLIGRVSRLAAVLDQSLREVFAEHGLVRGEFDLLATLLRSGAPHRLTVGDLHRNSMVTSGAITHRLDRLEGKGLVSRQQAAHSRRVVEVQLTAEGKRVVEAALEDHLRNEHRLVEGLSAAEREQLAGLLRAWSMALDA